jgi:hypothetical protein
MLVPMCGCGAVECMCSGSVYGTCARGQVTCEHAWACICVHCMLSQGMHLLSTSERNEESQPPSLGACPPGPALGPRVTMHALQLGEQVQSALESDKKQNLTITTHI